MVFARSVNTVRQAASAASARSCVAAAGRRSFTTQKAGAIPVAAADDGAPTSAITVAIKAGPRYETSPGAAHILKNYVFKSTEKRSALSLVRESELYGGVLSASLSKEHLFLTAEFLRGDESFFAQILGEVLSSSKFLRHEYEEEVIPNVLAEYEQAISDPTILAFDQLTQTAFRHRGIGASLFASPIAPLTHTQAAQFARTTFGQDNIAVLGSGIESQALASLVSKHFAGVSTGSAATSKAPSKYFGGEQRVAFAAPHGAESTRASHGHVVVAFEGAAAGAAPELAVLRALLGGESSIKWSTGVSPLSQVAAKHAGASATAFNLAFSDAGLFGAYVSAPYATIDAAVKDTINAIKEVASSASEEDVRKAVAKAKFEAASALERRAGSHEIVGAQLLEASKVATLDAAFSALDGVKASALSSAAGKLLKGKPTTVAVGDIHKLPYGDESI